MEKCNDNSSNNVVTTNTSDFQPFSCRSGQETSTFESGASSGSKTEDFPCLKYQQKPRKKLTKLIKIDVNGVRSGGIAKPKYAKKPDPGAPKITKPCSECGKKFWSWKALFGHMRCHPERQWRGINPPPNFRQQQPPVKSETNKTSADFEARVTLEDHEVATCLLMLANGSSAPESPTVTTACNVMNQGILESDPIAVRDPLMMGFRDVETDDAGPSGMNCSRFECSSCKKVFGSHQALGGHRATHKNVKGCFAIHRNDDHRNDDEEQDLMGDVRNDGEVEVKDAGDDKMIAVYGHKCSICLKVFSSGQALGGHKRCHWEKGDEPGLTQPLNPFAAKGGCGLDLNLPPPATADDDSSCSYSSGLALDLRLGL